MKYIEVQERTEPWPSMPPYPAGAWLVSGNVYIVDQMGSYWTMLMSNQVTLKSSEGSGSGVDVHRLFDQLLALKK